MFGLGFQELVVVLVIALLFFGGNKLPEVGSALGKAIREFKHAAAEPGPPAGEGTGALRPSGLNIRDESRSGNAPLVPRHFLSLHTPLCWPSDPTSCRTCLMSMSSYALNAGNLVLDFGEVTGAKRKTLALISD